MSRLKEAEKAYRETQERELIKALAMQTPLKMNGSDFETHIKRACEQLAGTLIKKNRDYKNSYVKTVDKYGNTVPLIRLNDKFSRLENLILRNEGEQEVEEETVEDNLLDLAGYAILEYARRKSL